MKPGQSPQHSEAGTSDMTRAGGQGADREHRERRSGRMRKRVERQGYGVQGSQRDEPECEGSSPQRTNTNITGTTVAPHSQLDRQDNDGQAGHGHIWTGSSLRSL